jgi:hypothetical protein
MTRQEVVEDAQKYANQINRDVFVLRRGLQYKGSAIEHKGWSVAEIVSPRQAIETGAQIVPGMKMRYSIFPDAVIKRGEPVWPDPIVRISTVSLVEDHSEQIAVYYTDGHVEMLHKAACVTHLLARQIFN